MNQITNKNGKKGLALEETLRAYFLKAGFYVLRGIPFEIDNEVITDIDLWLYERPSGTTRRRQIVDIKSTMKPKAKERIVWTKGVCEALEIDSAYVATPDNSHALRKIAKKLNISILDGNDLRRIEESQKVSVEERLTDEEMNLIIKEIEKVRKNKSFSETLKDLKASVASNFGASSAVRALQAMEFFAQQAMEAHPTASSAKFASRMVLLSASIAAISFDFVGSEFPFRTADERRDMFINTIRFGNPDKADGTEQLRLAMRLIREYQPNGAAAAITLEKAMNKDFEKIPAEIIADQILRMDKSSGLFAAARELEMAAYSQVQMTFDTLSVPTRSFLGALLDFSGIERIAFSQIGAHEVLAVAEPAENSAIDYVQGDLMDKLTTSNAKRLV